MLVETQKVEQSKQLLKITPEELIKKEYVDHVELTQETSHPEQITEAVVVQEEEPVVQNVESVVEQIETSAVDRIIDNTDAQEISTEEPLAQKTAEVSVATTLDAQPMIETAKPEIVHQDTEVMESKTQEFLTTEEEVAESKAEPVMETDEAPSPIEIISKIVEEVLDVPEEVNMAVENFISEMPEDISTALAEFIEASEGPEVQEAIVLIVNISRASERLAVLFENGDVESEEAMHIEQLIREWYVELLEKANIEHDEEVINGFIELIKSGDYLILAEVAEDEYIDDGMHEVLSSLFATAQDATYKLAKQLHIEKLGKLTVQAVAS